MEIVIKKATIQSSIFLSYDYEIKDSNANNVSKTKSDAPIHDDLRNAFRSLIPHFAFICEEITNEEGEAVEKKLPNDVFKKPTKGKGKKIAEEEF